MRAKTKQRLVKVVNFLPAGGICTTVKPWLLPANKLERALNVMLIASLASENRLTLRARTRPGTRRISAAPLPGGEQIRAHLRLMDTDYLASDAALYRLDAAGLPVLVGAVAEAPSLVAYRGYGLVLDGGHLKSVDPAADHAYGVVWDNGGLMHGTLDQTPAGSTSLHAGGITRAGVKLTLPSWGPGSIALDSLKAVLTKLGSPTGNLKATFYSADGGALLATSAALDVAELPSETAASLHQTLSFASGAPASAGQTIIAAVEYSGGDASNCVRLHHATSDGNGRLVTYAGRWSAVDSGKEPLLALGPGLAPKARVGAVKAERLFLGGGGDTAEERSRLHYCQALDLYNWGGQLYQGGAAGWVGVARHDGGGINGIARYFEDLYVSKSGGGEQSLHVVTGTIPGLSTEGGDMKVSPVFHHEGAVSGRTLVEVGNNLLFLSADAVLAVEAIPGGGFGNLRKFPQSRDVANLIAGFADARAFAVYDRARDQYWLQLAGQDQTLVYHDLAKAWTAYQWAGFSPTCFNHQDGQTFIGAGGQLYVMDDAVASHDGYRDGDDTGQAFASEVWGPMLDLGAGWLDKEFKLLAYEISARLGASGQVAFMLRGDSGHLAALDLSHAFLLPLDPDVVVGELDGLSVGEGVYPVGGQADLLAGHPLNFNANACQVRLTLNPGGAPVHLGPVNLTLAILGRS